jgi:hypothetical protein
LIIEIIGHADNIGDDVQQIPLALPRRRLLLSCSKTKSNPPGCVIRVGDQPSPPMKRMKDGLKTGGLEFMVVRK